MRSDGRDPKAGESQGSHAAAPLISAIIPVHNRSGFIGEAVASVLGQTWPRVECVVVDDGSTDETPAVLAAIRAPGLRVLRQENRGVSAARNAGIAAAKGDFIALLDSDDLWLPEKLARQMAFMRQEGVDVCQTREIWMRGGRRVNPAVKHVKRDGDFFREALKMCLVSPSSVLMTRRVFEEAGPFDESLPACEDYDLWLRILLSRRIGLVEEDLAVRRGGRPDQLSGRFIGIDLFRIRSLVKLLARDDIDPWRRDCIKEELARKAGVYVRGCLKRGKPVEAARVADMVRQAMG